MNSAHADKEIGLPDAKDIGKKTTARPLDGSPSLTNTRRLAAPLVASPKVVCRMLDCGLTRLYELLARGELQSFTEGRARKITLSSIEDFIARRLAASGSGEPRRDLVESAVRAVKQERARRAAANVTAANGAAVVGSPGTSTQGRVKSVPQRSVLADTNQRT